MILRFVVLALLLAFVDCDPLPAHAGAERVLVPLAPCWVPSCPTPPGWREAGPDGDGLWGYGHRRADGRMRWVRATP
jgi:hypothetical protein